MRHGVAETEKLPIIAISTKETLNAGRPHDTPLDSQSKQYSLAVMHAHGTPLLLPPYGENLHEVEGHVSSVLDVVDGLIVAGGSDVHPSLYTDEPPHSKWEPTPIEYDLRDMELTRQAEERDIPMLLICRGLQMWNVVRGGTLHQHVPDLRAAVGGTPTDHVNQSKEQVEDRLHAVTFEPVSVLGRLVPQMAGGPLWVDSHHHQAIDRLGAGLRPIAQSPDGLIEAVQSADSRVFNLGTQWHPESTALTHPDSAVQRSPEYHAAVSLSRSIFGAFMRAAQGLPIEEQQLAAA